MVRKIIKAVLGLIGKLMVVGLVAAAFLGELALWQHSGMVCFAVNATLAAIVVCAYLRFGLPRRLFGRYGRSSSQRRVTTMVTHPNREGRPEVRRGSRSYRRDK